MHPTNLPKTGRARGHRARVRSRDHPLPQDLRQSPGSDRLHGSVLEDEQHHVTVQGLLCLHHSLPCLLRILCSVHLPRQGFAPPPRRGRLPARAPPHGVRPPDFHFQELDVRCVLHRRGAVGLRCGVGSVLGTG